MMFCLVFCLNPVNYFWKNYLMNTEEEKFAKTEPFVDANDVDLLAKQAGLEMKDNEELNLKNKLEERDENLLEQNSDEEV
jgi:hypothetical protein